MVINGFINFWKTDNRKVYLDFLTNKNFTYLNDTDKITYIY